MLSTGEIFLKILEFLCFLALAILLSAAIGYGVLSGLGECQNYFLDAKSCSSGFYRGIASYTYTVIFASLFAIIPILLALGGIIAVLRRMHIRQSVRLIDQDRENDVTGLGYFVAKHLFVGCLLIIIIIAAIWTFAK